MFARVAWPCIGLMSVVWPIANMLDTQKHCATSNYKLHDLIYSLLTILVSQATRSAHRCCRGVHRRCTLFAKRADLLVQVRCVLQNPFYLFLARPFFLKFLHTTSGGLQPKYRYVNLCVSVVAGAALTTACINIHAIADVRNSDGGHCLTP